MSPTPVNSSLPRGLTAWRQRLVAVDLPLLSPPSTVETLLSEDLPTARLMEGLQRDLPLGLALLLEAQRRLRGGQQVASLSHAVGALGLGGIHAVVKRLARHPLNPALPGHPDYAEAIATSRLAAHLVAQFAPDDPLDERLRKMWEMQVQMMAEWRLPLAAPDLARQMNERIAAGERPALVEHALLGCRMYELNTALAIHYGLLEKDDHRATQTLNPQHLRKAARLAWTDTNPRPVPDALGRWLFQPSTLPSLLHLLAQEGMRSWYSPRTRMLQNILSTHRHWRIEEVMAATRRAAVAASREMLTSGVLVPPAARLMWEPLKRPRRTLGGAGVRTAPAPTPPAQARPPAPPTQVTPRSMERGAPARLLIDQFVDDCAKARHPSLAAFFQAFERTLLSGLGLKRFIVFLKTSQADQLVCFMARGFGPTVAPRQLTINLSDGNLIAKVFRQPHGFLLAQGERMADLRRRLPPSLRDELTEGGAIWGSVQVHERPVGVVWADDGPGSTAIDDVQYGGFKRLTRHFGDALTRLIREQKAQRQSRP